MAEHAPEAIKKLFDAIKKGVPSAINGGIVGDSAHTYGYHRGRKFVSSSDYSVQLSADKQGNAEAACGLDISWSKAADQYTVSKRLLDAKNDARMKKAVREFYGSTDGKKVCGWDYQGGYSVTSDSSHLWHVHLSILRAYSNDWNALAPVADVITGKASDDMNEKETEEMIANAFRAYHKGGQYGRWSPAKYPDWIKDAANGVADRLMWLEKKTGKNK